MSSVKYGMVKCDLISISEGEIVEILAETEKSYVINFRGTDVLIDKGNILKVSDNYSEIRASFLTAMKACGGNLDYDLWKDKTLDEVLLTLAPNGVRFYYEPINEGLRY